jgi:hypothetical protein
MEEQQRHSGVVAVDLEAELAPICEAQDVVGDR